MLCTLGTNLYLFTPLKIKFFFSITKSLLVYNFNGKHSRLPIYLVISEKNHQFFYFYF